MPTTNSSPQNKARFRVIKVGGSLFSMHGLRERIEVWSAKHLQVGNLDCVNVWVAGGGTIVDAVRHWQTLHGLGDIEAHRISLDLLSTTATLLQSLFSDWQMMNEFEKLIEVEISSSDNVVFDCSKWAKMNGSLKADWETTSDSIALQLAIELNAWEFHLLKSASPASNNIEDAIVQGLLDPSFATHLGKKPGLCPIISNLRDSCEPTILKI